MRAAGAWVAAVVLLGSTGARGAVGGLYQTPLGKVAVKKTGDNVTAAAAEDGGPCAFKKGQTILKGSIMDDSVTGKLSICTEGCGTQEAFVVLLIARGGDLLSGAVQLKNKACKLPMEGKGIAFSRASSSGGKPAHVAKAARVKPRASGNKPPPAEPKATAPGPSKVTDAELSTRFEDWNPDVATSDTAVDRAEAVRRGRDAEKLVNSGQFEAAHPVIIQALKADPGYAEGYVMMGVTFYARDSYDDALDWYKKALTANPDFGDAYYNIACIYAFEGKKPLALKYLRIALLNGYAQRAVIEKDPDLDSLRGEPEYAELMKFAEAPPPKPGAGDPSSSSSSGPAAPPPAAQ